MRLVYELYVRHEVYETLSLIRSSSRQRILNFVEYLAQNPFDEGDLAEQDRSGWECQVKIIGKFALYYRADHADKEVRIVDLIDADRI